MIIFRSSAGAFGLLLAGCSTGNPLPDEATLLGQVARINNFAEREVALQRFAEARLDRPQALRAELLRAGFKERKFREQGVECQGFDWNDEGMFPVVMLVNICGRTVSANAGQIAP